MSNIFKTYVRTGPLRCDLLW